MTLALRRRSALRLIIAVTAVALAASLPAQAVTLTRGSPQEVGMSPAVLEAGVGLYREAVERGELVGAVLLVARNGKVVLHEAVQGHPRGLSVREAEHLLLVARAGEPLRAVLQREHLEDLARDGRARTRDARRARRLPPRPRRAARPR